MEFVYVVLIEDRLVDTQIWAFGSKAEAMARGNALADERAARPDDRGPSAEEDGWLLHRVYGLARPRSLHNCVTVRKVALGT